MGDDVPLTKGFAQEGASKEMSLILDVDIGPSRRECLSKEVSNVHRSYIPHRFVSNVAAQPENDAAVRILSAESVVLDDQPAAEAKRELTIEALGGGRHAECYSVNFPRGKQKPLVPQDVFGGITDCEGGGGWVSRTPFLVGNRRV